jgi:CDP-diacylglycerol--glycerol-3-phosphate 3-phosphatidyltransferase
VVIMPSIYQLKPAFQNILRPIVRACARAGVTPNQVTVAAMVLSFAAGACIVAAPDARWPLFVLPAALLLRMARNAIDGVLAREFQLTSAKGAVLNEIGDVVSDAAMYLPLGLVEGLGAHWVIAVVVLGIVSEMTGVVAQTLTGERRYDGPMGKSDRAFVFGVMALALALGVRRGWYLDLVLAVNAFLLVATILNRARAATRGGP